MRSSILMAALVLSCGARTEVDWNTDVASAAGGPSAGGGNSSTTGGTPAPSYVDCDEAGPCSRAGELCLIDNEQATGQYCTVPCTSRALCAPSPNGIAHVDCRSLPSSPVAVCALDCSDTAPGLRGPCPEGMTCHQFPVGGRQHTCMWRD